MAVALCLAGDAWWESGATSDSAGRQMTKILNRFLFVQSCFLGQSAASRQALSAAFHQHSELDRAGRPWLLAPLHRPHLGLAGSCPGPALARVGKPKAQDLLSYGRYRLVPTIAASIRHGTKPSPLPPGFLFTTCTCLPASSLTTTVRRRHADLPTFVHPVRKWAFTIFDSSSLLSITLPLQWADLSSHWRAACTPASAHVYIMAVT